MHKKGTALMKYTRLYDETQGTMKHKRFRQGVFVGCKKRERERENRIKKEGSKEEDRQGVDVNQC